MKVAVIASLLILSLFLFGCTQGPPASALTESPATIIQPASVSQPTGGEQPLLAENQTPANVQAPSPSPASSDNSTASQSTVKEFTMTAKQWEFQPATVTVNRGDRVKLIVKSIDVTHGFSLPDFNVNTRLEPGVDTVVEFTADKTGTFTFFCSVVCGSGHSEMRGSLVVVG